MEEDLAIQTLNKYYLENKKEIKKSDFIFIA